MAVLRAGAAKGAPVIAIGMRVQVVDAQAQSKVLLGRAMFPGRTGIVVRVNPFGSNEPGGMWYVTLDPTSRAKTRTELFRACMLIPLPL